MKEKENYEFEKELHNQQKEYLKSKGHVDIEVIVGEDDNQPYIDVDIHGANQLTIAKTIITIENLLNDLKKDFPIANILRYNYNIKTEKSVKFKYDENGNLIEDE